MITLSEADYGAALLMQARKDKQRKRFPSQPAGGTPESEVPALIIDAIKQGNHTSTRLSEAVGIGRPKLINHLYRMRGNGKIHSVPHGRTVKWRIGPAEAAA